LKGCSNELLAKGSRPQSHVLVAVVTPARSPRSSNTHFPILSKLTTCKITTHTCCSHLHDFMNPVSHTSQHRRITYLQKHHKHVEKTALNITRGVIGRHAEHVCVCGNHAPRDVERSLRTAYCEYLQLNIGCTAGYLNCTEIRLVPPRSQL
jgi:hypothetical protein